MAENLLYCELTSQTASLAPGGNAFALPLLVEGDDLQFRFRFTTRVDGGGAQVVQRVAASLKASLGLLDARPTAGTWALKLGSSGISVGANTTGALAIDIAAADLQAALNALTLLSGASVTTAVTLQDGSYFLAFSDGATRDITLVHNTTFPRAYLQLALDATAGNEYELRLTQKMAALTTDLATSVVPAPTVATVVTGSSDAGNQRNAVQQITFPAGFASQYTLSFGGLSTPVLQAGSGADADGPAQVQAALNALYAGSGGSFLVTNPSTSIGQIEFQGTLGNSPQSEVAVTVYGAATPDPVCTLSLESEALRVLLNALTVPGTGITLPLQITLQLQDVNDPDILHGFTPVRQNVTIVRSLTDPSVLTVPDPSWLTDPLPQSYLPFVPAAVVTGQQFYITTFGDGAATVFTFAHGLATESIASILIRENASPSPVQLHGTDYTWRINDADSIQVTVLGGAPAAAALAIIITAAQPRTQLLADFEIEPGNVDGLSDALALLAGQVATLNTLTGLNANVAAPAGTSPVQVIAWTFAPFSTVLPLRHPVAIFSSIATLPLPVNGRHLGALYSALQVTAHTTMSALPGSPAAGVLYQNTGSAVLDLPGFQGNLSAKLYPNQFAAWDARGAWYRVDALDGRTTYADGTYYPVGYDIELCTLALSNAMLVTGATLAIQLGIELALLQANTEGQYILCIEAGYGTQDTGSGATQNLASMAWQRTAMVKQLFLPITDTPTVHTFGLTLSRTLRPPPISCTTVSTSTTVTTAGTAALAVGAAVSGAGIPVNATIATITDATHFVLSAAATASGTVPLTFIVDTLIAALQQYGGSTGADNPPLAAWLNGLVGNVLGLRFFLRGFDPEDISAPSGYIAARGPAAVAGAGAAGGTLGQAIVTINQPQTI